MTALQRTPGRKVTRRLQDPTTFVMGGIRRSGPGALAGALADCHNRAVQEYGSNSGGVHAFDPEALATQGVYEAGGAYPQHTVISSLSWGKISPELAQRLLEMEGLV